LDAVATPVIVIELHKRLLVWEKELNEQENTLVATEDDVGVAELALGRAHMECDAEHDRVKVV
jgi:hypothetical protein